MYKTEGLVLKKIDAGEADAFFVIYTRDFGKIRALAQGVKKEEAKLKGHLEPLNLVSLQFVLGKNRERLTGAELLEYWPRVRSDREKLACAFGFARLLDTEFLAGEKDENIWNLGVSAFSVLEKEAFSPGELAKFVEKFVERLQEFLGVAGPRRL